VHDFLGLADRFKTERPPLRTLALLLFDHIGGLDVLLQALSRGACLIVPENRDPATVLETVAKHHVELLPASPTFLNLILLSKAFRAHPVPSLKLVAYGTEPMLETTLGQLHRIWPHVKFVQTYGLSELGVARTKAKSSDSVWMKIGGPGFETKIVDGVLHVKATSAMLGYLNAAAPLTADGWYNTGDRVETDGEWMRILGRESEIINIGGNKVSPAEIEEVIRQMVNVAEVRVYGEKNAITGQIVCAEVALIAAEPKEAFLRRLKTFCAERLSAHKVPIRVSLVESLKHGERLKKSRTAR
jgi:acyl-CoA synthetase (AMP-forming)/AMP-acid ligase II